MIADRNLMRIPAQVLDHILRMCKRTLCI
jgi:hypothetical protein